MLVLRGRVWRQVSGSWQHRGAALLVRATRDQWINIKPLRFGLNPLINSDRASDPICVLRKPSENRAPDPRGIESDFREQLLARRVFEEYVR